MIVEVSSPSSDLERRARVHTALADPHRLRIADLLASSDRTPSELAADLAIGSNLLAHHLRILEDAGVVERLRSEGDARRRYLRLSPAAIARSSIAGVSFVADRVLFVCTGNTARSQLAAALWNLRSEVPAESAGTHPAREVHPGAIRAGRKAGVDLTGARPRAIDQVPGIPDLIVTVCDRAHEELGALTDEATVIHWWIPDPRETGTAAAFEDSVTQLRHRIDTLSPHVVRTGRRRSPRRTRP
ncbi:MAG: arsenate reductase/protein-tyrosine-phosphatase family protein [Actinomycetota bacterium]